MIRWGHNYSRVFRGEVPFRNFPFRNITWGLRRVSLSEPPTTVMLMARAFSPTLQGPISLVHRTDFRFLFYALSWRFWYITRPPTRLAPEGLIWLDSNKWPLIKVQFTLFKIGDKKLKDCAPACRSYDRRTKTCKSTDVNRALCQCFWYSLIHLLRRVTWNQKTWI